MIENINITLPKQLHDVAAKAAESQGISLGAWMAMAAHAQLDEALRRARRHWYLIIVMDKPVVPEGEVDLIDFLTDPTLNPPEHTVCYLQAKDDDDALHLYKARTAGLDTDVGNPDRIFRTDSLADRLMRFNGPKKPSVSAFVKWPRSQRPWPSLDEWVDKLLEESKGACEQS